MTGNAEDSSGVGKIIAPPSAINLPPGSRLALSMHYLLGRRGCREEGQCMGSKQQRQGSVTGNVVPQEVGGMGAGRARLCHSHPG